MGWVYVEDEYECAYCETMTTKVDVVLTKWGFATRYECPAHGMYFVFKHPESSMQYRGTHISPVVK